MQAVGRVCGLGIAVSFALLAPSVPAAAAHKPITGKLSRPGYTVIALAENGRARVVRASQGRFSLRPPAKRVTLHLRAPKGTYAGPLVVGRKKKGKVAIVGVKAGARLGRVKVRGGYARLSKRLRKRWVDSTRTARARRGVPIGARVFGHVRSKLPRRLLPADPDLDGIPDRLDIDDDGDLILDYADRSSAARTADHVPGHPPAPTFGVMSFLELVLGQTANANPRHSTDPTRPAFEDADIDQALKRFGALAFGLEGGHTPGPGFPSPERSELDCAGDPDANPPVPALVYCTRGGTGSAFDPRVGFVPGAPPTTVPFPGDPGAPFDHDGDGFGTFPPGMGFGPHLFHGATSFEIKTGDVLVQRGNDVNGVETDSFTTTLQYVFATVPALASYDDDGLGGKPPTSLAYPYPPGFAHDLLVAPRPSGDPFAGDVVVTLTFWRPQRRRIANDPVLQPGDSPTWTDIGGLYYGAGTAGLVGPCGQRAFLPEDDPSLTDLPPPLPGSQGAVAGGGGFADVALDRPANPNNKLTYTLNLTECLRSGGKESLFDEAGEVRLFGILSVGQGGRATQYLSFKRQ
jgi:hypothetical protein